MTGALPLSPLEEENEGLLRFLNAAPVGLLQVSLNGDVQLINGHAAKLLLPLARDRSLHNLFTALGPQAALLKPLIEAHGQKPGPICTALRLQVTEEAEGNCVLALTLVRLGPKQLLAALADLTEQARLERALQASQLRLRLAMDTLHLAEFELDLRNGEFHRSALHDRLFGHATPLPVWNMASWTRQVHADDVGDWLHGLQAALEGGRTWRSEFRVVWPDASVHWLSAQGHIERDETGRALRLLCILADTSEQRSAAEARAQRLAAEEDCRRAREASRMKSQFLAQMSHELRTPLNAIIGFAELLRLPGSVSEPARQQRFLDHIASSGHHLLQLINDVLDMAKVESGKFEFHPEPLDLLPLTTEVAGALQTTAEVRRVAVSVHVDGTLHQGVALDPLRLKQVMFNFLSNALKHAPAGSRVDLRLMPQGPAHLRLEVEDHGPGIPAAQQHRLFQEFEQLADGSERPVSGTGLGLALTRQLVEAQGGHVGVHSEPGVCTVFHAVLNRQHGHDLAASTAETRPAPRLLMLEGDAATRQQALQQLAAAGIEARAAGSVSQAEDLLRRQAFEALTLGLPLPDAPGLEGLSRLRAVRVAQPPAVRGLGWPTNSGLGVHFAVADVLSKPLRREELLAALEALGLQNRSAPPRVLVAEDDPVALELMVALLGHLGAEAYGVVDAEALIPALAAHQPDAVIVDLTMQGRDGLQTLHLLRSDDRWADLPVLLWTALDLSPTERARLTQSAHGIAEAGGGTLTSLVADLARWHTQVQLRHAATLGPTHG